MSPFFMKNIIFFFLFLFIFGCNSIDSSSEISETENIVAELASTFSTAAKELQSISQEDSSEPVTEDKQPRRRRRKHGTELTLDD